MAAPSTTIDVPAQVEWPTDKSAYTFLGKIGQGAFASVWKAETQLPDGATETVAVKILNLDHVDSNLTEIRMEVQLMRLSLHPNVLTCHTAFLASTQLCLVTPFMNKGSAVHCMKLTRKLPEPPQLERHILYILRETVLGLQYIHDNGQIHRDIKGQNILLDGSGSVKLADFGVSGWLIPQNEKAKTFVGTPCWMAPEVMEQVHGYDYKADLWSLGITALELAKGYAPYARYPPMKVLILTIQEEPPSLETYDYAEQDDDDAVTQEWSKEFRQIISWLLQKDTTKRPTCQQLLQSPLLRTRDDSRQSLQEEICNKVPDVGAPSGDEKITLPGLAPVSILTTTAEDRPAGTTWVFADGSQVLASDAKERELDDVLQELDAFSGETGGENYKKEEGQQQEEGETDKKNESDDLDDFLDEFEKTTAGENFQR